MLHSFHLFSRSRPHHQAVRQLTVKSAAQATKRPGDASQFHVGKTQVCERQVSMFLLLAIVLVILWAGGFFLFHVSGFLIHLLIIFAVISLVFHLISGRKA
jgi:hypothetical protein